MGHKKGAEPWLYKVLNITLPSLQFICKSSYFKIKGLEKEGRVKEQGVGLGAGTALPVSSAAGSGRKLLSLQELLRLSCFSEIKCPPVASLGTAAGPYRLLSCLSPHHPIQPVPGACALAPGKKGLSVPRKLQLSWRSGPEDPSPACLFCPKPLRHQCPQP